VSVEARAGVLGWSSSHEGFFTPMDDEGNENKDDKNEEGRSQYNLSAVEKKTISTATTASTLGPPPPMMAPGEDDTARASGLLRFLFRQL